MTSGQPTHVLMVLGIRSLVHRGVALAVAVAGFVPLVFASPDDERILGFESLSDWTFSEGSGTVTLNSASSSGQNSVTLGGTGFRRMTSANVTTLGAGDASVIQVDVRIDASLQSWESAGIVVKIPSRGIYWQDLGMIGLGGVQPGTWSTLSFPVPTGLRENLQSTMLQDIQLILAANTSSAPVSFDRLRLLTPPPGNPPPPRPTVTPPQSGELGKPYTPRFLSCSTSTTTVTDVDAEFEDIWAKRETPWQGKRTSQVPSVGLRFSGPVDPSMVNASFFPRNVSQCGGRIQAAAVAAPALWQGSETSSAIGRLSASDYNAIVLGAVSGTPSSEGPIAAGGSVTLSSFSLNGSAQRPIGLIAGGTVSLSNGSVHGNVQTSADWAPPETVSITGGAPVLGADGLVSATMLSLSELSASLGSSRVTGTTASAWGGLTLTGSDTERNVFEVAAGDLASASNVTIDVPNGSSAIVNIRGTFGSIKNKGFNLQGISAERLLWNAPELVSVEIASVAFPGSLLAPRADVVFNNGNFRGTLVAFSLNGSGSFSFAPLDALSVLGEGVSDLVRFLPVKKLRPECEYTFEIVANQALSDAGNCLDKWFVVRFFTRPDGAGVMDDLTELRRTENAPGLTAFAPREGVYINAEEALVRYKEAMGVPLDDVLEFDGTQRRHPRIPNAEIVRARQYHEGIFVWSPGYFVERHADGRLIYARGRAVVLPEDSSTPTLSRSAARSAAAPYTLETGGPGTTLGPEESITLRYVNGKGTPASEDYELAWNVPVMSGDSRVGEIDISATTGGLVRHSHYMIAEHHADYLAHMQTLSFQGMTEIFYTNAEGTLSSVEGVQLRDASEDLLKTFASGDPTTTLPLALTAGYLITDRTYEANGIRHDLDGDGMISWGPSVDWETRSAPLAALFASVRPAEQFLLEYPLEFDGSFWKGIDGTGVHGVTVQYQLAASGSSANAGSYRPSAAGAIPKIQYNEGPSQEHPLPYPTAGYHELGHAVFDWVRERSGQRELRHEHETGAILEGLGDIFASSVSLTQGSGSAPWPLIRTLQGLDVHNRHTGIPEVTGNPDFYKGARYCLNEDDSCGGGYRNSTILSHWAYLLTTGSPGAGVCNVPVQSLGTSLPDARNVLMQLLFESIPDLEEMGRFIDLRDVTYKRALQTSDSMAQAVASAWLAVGLGSPTSPVPGDGEENVNPWDTKLEFIASLPGEYTIQVAEDEDFTSEATTKFVEAVEADSEVSTSFRLKPKTRYYWRVGPGRLPNQAEGWGQCSLGTWSFTTANRVATIETLDREGDRYVTDFLGLVQVELPEGANSVGLQFSVDEPPSCEDAHDYVSSSIQERYFLLGDSFDPIARFEGPDGRTQVAPYEEGPPFPAQYYVDAGIPFSAAEGMTPVFGTLVPGTVGYLTVTPMRGQERGQCSTFEVTTTELGSFAKIGRDPDSEEWYYPNFVVLDHSTGKPQNGLEFTPSAGALEYEARISSTYLDPTTVKLMKSDRRSPDCGLHLDDGVYTWTFDGCGNEDFLDIYGRGIPSDTNQYRGYAWELWALGEKGQMRLSATDGMDFAGGLPFAFVWNGVAWHPRRKVEPHMFFQGTAGSPIWLYAANSLAPPHLPELRRLFVTLPDERFPAAEDWLDLKLAAVKKSARIHEVQLCIPRQLPFMDRVVVYLLTVRRMGQVDEEVVYGEGVAFETAQGRNGSDCHSFVMDTSNPPDDQVAVIVRGLAPGYSAAPQGFFISDIHGDMDEGEDRLDEDENDDDDEGGDDEDDDQNCLEFVPTPEPAAGQPFSPCTSTGDVLATDSIGETSFDLLRASCPEVAPAVPTLSFGVRPNSTVAGYLVGVCGNPGSCKVTAVKSNANEPAFRDFLPGSPGVEINSDNNRYTYTIYAHDGCGNLSTPLMAQLDYVGSGCNPTPSDSACGTICEQCCDQGCSFSCLHPNCDSCKTDDPNDSGDMPYTCPWR
jgi:choice-of-anchor A domain-containing protein